MKKMCPVVHFEMPAIDRKRMRKFYTDTFGWETEQLDEDMWNYVTVMTTESDKNGPKKPWAINGWFYDKTDDKLSQCPWFVISVDNAKEYIKKLENAWWKVQWEPMNIPWVWLYVSFIDTEGNRVGILEPTMNM